MITFNNTKTLLELVKNIGKEFENNVFLRYERDDTIFEKGYGTFSMDTMSVAVYIEGQNKKAGHKIHAAVLGKCSYEYLTVLLGVPCGGGVSIPMDVKLTAQKMAENLKKADTDILFYDYSFSSQADELRELCPFIKRFICLQTRKNSRNVPIMHKVFRGETVKEKINPDMCAMIIFTSGTTGHGKGVMLSHANLIDNMFCTDDAKEVCLNVLPIHHIFCISSDVLLALRYGSTLCICDDMSKILYYIKLFQPTVIRVVPMIAKMFVNRIAILRKKNPERSIVEIKEEVLGKRLNRLVSGGGYLSETLSDALLNFGIVTGQGYGMSECSPKISVPDYTRRDKMASVGHLVTGCHVRIVDGEIQVKSPSVMMGYYNDEELTKEAITEDGWLCTGDLGYVDDEDFLYLNGRKKNLIILSNGENVSPEMIENYFDEDRLVQDIIVYGKDDIIAAEIYPNYEYAQVNGITDIETAINILVKKHNEQLPSYSRIADVTVRKTAFEKTSSNKIIRKVYFDEKEESNKKKINSTKAETKIQRQLYDMIAEQIGNPEFGINDNFYDCGLDSLGSSILITELSEKINVNITLAELMENADILKLEALIKSKTKQKKTIDEDAENKTVKEIYPLTAMQKYFAYIIPDNTTGNLPFVFRMDKTVETYRLIKAIGIVLDAHPSLKAIVKPTEQKYYAIYRDDNRNIDIGVEKIQDKDAEKKMQELIVPFRYRENDNLVHIHVFEGEKFNYMFFDVAHFMGDGVSMNILMEDLCAAYKGEKVEKEKYTTFDYITEEQKRIENGVRDRDIKYVDTLMSGIKLKRSILNKTKCEELSEGVYGVIRKRFDKLPRKQVLYYGKKHGVSENALFIAAFNYCISMYSDEDEVFVNSIHSGRTDSRWNRIVGPLFETYYCKYDKVSHEKVEKLLKRTGKQIMETMKCLTSCPRQGEMFLQFQGDILETPQIGGENTERMHVQLDSLPFHLQVMYDDKGYYAELRFWENRFDKKLLEIFLDVFESILFAMLDETSVRCLKEHLPQEVYPKHYYVNVSKLNKAAGSKIISEEQSDEPIKVYVLDDDYLKKPYGAWGKVYIMDYEPINCAKTVQYPYGEGTLYDTGVIGRILPDGTIDFLENAGRTVLTDGIHGRKYYDLKLLEKYILEYGGVKDAECYLAYDPEINEMSLYADIKTDSAQIDIAGLKEFVRDKAGDDVFLKNVEIVQ